MHFSKCKCSLKSCHTICTFLHVLHRLHLCASLLKTHVDHHLRHEIINTNWIAISELTCGSIILALTLFLLLSSYQLTYCAASPPLCQTSTLLSLFIHCLSRFTPTRFLINSLRKSLLKNLQLHFLSLNHVCYYLNRWKFSRQWMKFFGKDYYQVA